MSEIVKYHNDFNKIQLPSFTEQEQNLLFLIFARIKEKGIDNEINLYANDFKINEKLSNSREYLTENINSLKYKFFKANFKQIIETKTEVIHRYINLFETMEIHYVKRNPDDGYDESTLFNRITLKINPDFSYLVNQLTTNFTAFELEEFIALSGKYTKTLYRLLKQYRTTGTARFKWEEFCRIMNIPQNLAMRDIDKGILKPALKELTKKRNLFEQIRMPFVNLTYEKEKTAGRGRGGKVSGIVFTFKSESVLMQKLRKEELKIATDEQKCLNTLENMCGARIKFKYKNQILQIVAWDYQNLRVSLSVFKENDYSDFIAEGQIEFKKDNHKDFYQLINDFASSDILN